MPTPKATLITHPARARILTVLLGRQLTIGQIAALLPEVPLPSIYRHVRTLAEAEILFIADEVRVNGALTKVYAVTKGGANITSNDTAGATEAEQLSYFTSFLNTLMESFRTYLEKEGHHPGSDPIHGLMSAMNLSKEEHNAFLNALGEFLKPWRDLPLEGERKRVIFAHIIVPDLPDPPVS